MGFNARNGGGAEPNMFFPFVEMFQSFAGGTVEVTEASGYIFAACPVSKIDEGVESGDTEIAGELYQPSASPTLVFTDVAPSSYDPSFDASPPSVPTAYFLIAQVALADGVASVTKRFLFHNPSVQLDAIRFIPPSP